MFLVAAVAVSLFTYGAGIAVERGLRGRHPSAVYWSSVVALVVIWLGSRYAAKVTGDHALIFPLGMSFYTFQALSYLTEVYWEEQKAERNVMDFLLYMLLFMKFLSGPIERPGSLLPQLHKLKPATYRQMTYGMKARAGGTGAQGRALGEYLGQCRRRVQQYAVGFRRATAHGLPALSH